MKLYVFAIFSVIAIGFSYLQELKIERLKFSSVISDQRHIIQENQLRDYENQFKKYQEDNFELITKLNSSKTYEQGYRDALTKLNDPDIGTYAEGYQDAKNIYGEGWVSGYHKAMSQQKDVEVYKKSKENLSNGEGIVQVKKEE